MNTFNRALLIVLLIGVSALSIAVIFFAWVSADSALSVLDDGIDWLDDNQGTLEKTLVSSGAGLVALLALTLLYLEVVPPAGSDVGITDLKGGSATLSTDAVAQRIEDSISRVPYVSDAKVRVEGRRKGVSVALDVNVDPAANLAQVTDEVCDVVRDVLANRVHVALIDAPTVRLHYREARAGRQQQARRPAITAPPARAGLPEAPAQPVEDRTPALVGPRRGVEAQREADVQSTNRMPGNGSPAGPATVSGPSAPPVSPRPPSEREVWQPEAPRNESAYARPESPPPLHHPAPLYSRPDLDRPSPRPETVDDYRSAPAEEHRTDTSASAPSPYARNYDSPAPRPQQPYDASPAQNQWASTAPTDDAAPPMRQDAPRDETPAPDDYRPRPTDPYRGNI